MLQKNFLKIKEALIDNFKTYDHPDKLKSGKQTTSDLHIIFKSTHLLEYFNKLTGIMNDLGKERLLKSWGLKIDKKQKQFLHRHPENRYTSIFYIQNDLFFYSCEILSSYSSSLNLCIKDSSDKS